MKAALTQMLPVHGWIQLPNSGQIGLEMGLQQYLLASSSKELKMWFLPSFCSELASGRAGAIEGSTN